MANQKVVGQGWTWFENYAFVWAEWKVSTPTERRVQVGMGLFSGGEPRGEKVEVSGEGTVKTVGAGAMHVRVVDGGPPCAVTLELGDKGLIPIVRCQSFSDATVASLGTDASDQSNSYFHKARLDDEELKLVDDLNRSLEAFVALVERKRRLFQREANK
ncbi:hypothetical protein [Marinobacter sp.]|uniref:hypothetical protein n=1 Tax=Marinobacter sp. TaxID=50741 RepID=UPI002620B307|nr:hypothetical protein [Marinobacter sp.]